ncbi:MAG: FMN-binding negative transcriptional regulator [Myxococcales bacterium]|nr:FMN-binding negative transcriptional regulator [Myxococcales bacterium]
MSMYLPRTFAVSSPAHLRRFLEEHPFAAILAAHDGDVAVAHAPFLLDPGETVGRVRLHLARANPMAALATEGAALTLLVQGPDAYVSAAWYGEPSRQVPTWNYAAVRLRVRVERRLEGDALRALLGEVAARFEGDDPAWSLATLSPDALASMLPHIIGLSLVVEEAEGKFKVSQNRSLDDRARVASALTDRGRPDDLALARWMHALGVA